MVVGMHNGIIALLAPQQLNGTVGNDLVGIHVGCGTCAALDGIADKLVMEFTLQDLITGLADGFTDGTVQLPHRMVGDGAGLLDLGHGFDKLPAQTLAGDPEIFAAPQGLHTVIGIYGHLLLPYGIGFNTVCHGSNTSPASFFGCIIPPGIGLSTIFASFPSCISIFNFFPAFLQFCLHLQRIPDHTPEVCSFLLRPSNFYCYPNTPRFHNTRFCFIFLDLGAKKP